MANIADTGINYNKNVDNCFYCSRGYLHSLAFSVEQDEFAIRLRFIFNRFQTNLDISTNSLYQDRGLYYEKIREILLTSFKDILLKEQYNYFIIDQTFRDAYLSFINTIFIGNLVSVRDSIKQDIELLYNELVTYNGFYQHPEQYNSNIRRNNQYLYADNADGRWARFYAAEWTFNEDQKNISTADIIAKQLFENSLPEFANKKEFLVGSKYNIIEYQFRTSIDNVYVFMDRVNIGYLCLEINSPDRKILPFYDRLLERVLSIKADEKQFWKIAFFHGNRNPKLEKLFPVNYWKRYSYREMYQSNWNPEPIVRDEPDEEFARTAQRLQQYMERRLILGE